MCTEDHSYIAPSTLLLPILIGMLCIACRQAIPPSTDHFISDKTPGDVSTQKPAGTEEDRSLAPIESPTLAPTARPAFDTPVLGMNEEDARRRTLAQLDPRSKPEITSVILATAEEIEKQLLWVGSGGIQGELEDSDHWFVVDVRMSPPQLLGFSKDRNTSEGSRYLALFNAQTAAQFPSFGQPASRTKKDFVLAQVPTAAVIPTIVPGPTPTAPSNHQWPWPWGRSEPEDEPPEKSDALSAILRQPPFLNSTLQTVLRSYPLLPGNRWTYRQDLYEHSRWQGAIYTDTVKTLESINPLLHLVTLERTEQAIGPSNWSRNYPTYVLIWRDELYRSDSPSRIREWIDYFTSGPNMPTAAPNFQFAENHELNDDGRPAPDLRLPLRPGEDLPVADTGSNWLVEPAETMETKAGRIEGCSKASHSGNYAGWQWFCEGTGLVRMERLKGGSTNIISIIALEGMNLRSRVE